MRSALFLVLIASCLPNAAEAQNVVNVNSPSGPVFDPRPFGKYLVQVCTVPDGGPVQCPARPAPFPGVPPPPPPGPPGNYPVLAAAPLIPQTISIKLVGCLPGAVPCPAVVYPLPRDQPFFVKATSDSGLDVTQTVFSGNVTPGAAADGTVPYTIASPGTIVIRAMQTGNASYAGATPVDLILKVADSPGPGSSCSLLPEAPAQTPSRVDLQEIIALLGTPTPFQLVAQGQNTILIYATRYPLRPDEQAVLETIPANIAALAGETPGMLGVTGTGKPFKVELEIPHASALGDLAARISSLNFSGFTVQNVGTNRVRITSTSQPECDAWKGFLSSIRRLEWQGTPEPMNLKLYYLSSTDAATSFSSLNTAAGGSSPSSGSTSPAGGGQSAGSSSSPTISVNQPPGSNIDIRSDTTPCVIAGLATGNSNGCAPDSGKASAPSSSGGGAAAAPKPIGMAAMGVVAGTTEQNPSDLLVFSDTNPGDDALIAERKRILAQLDLPRPEMLINAWVMQNSSPNAPTIGAFTKTIREMVEQYNQAIDVVTLRGWASLKAQTEAPGFFDPTFSTTSPIAMWRTPRRRRLPIRRNRRRPSIRSRPPRNSSIPVRCKWPTRQRTGRINSEFASAAAIAWVILICFSRSNRNSPMFCSP